MATSTLRRLQGDLYQAIADASTREDGLDAKIEALSTAYNMLRKSGMKKDDLDKIAYSMWKEFED